MTSLEDSYRACRALNRKFGSTYFWSTALLPREQRPHVHALYAFCRYADDIVDVSNASSKVREEALTDFGDRFFFDLSRGDSDDEILKAVVHTTRQLEIDPEAFRRFLHSMHMDFRVHDYADFDALLEYMDGSAAVIGEMMLPVLQPRSKLAFEPARQLGIAFQLTNFLRDVNEDLDKGRVYIPQNTLLYFGADPHQREATPEWRGAMAFEIERARGIYETADAGLQYLPAQSRKCVAAARKLYSGILDQIEARSYDVFSSRVRVPRWKKLAAAARVVA